jgi:hypothetical protein
MKLHLINNSPKQQTVTLNGVAIAVPPYLPSRASAFAFEGTPEQCAVLAQNSGIAYYGDTVAPVTWLFTAELLSQWLPKKTATAPVARKKEEDATNNS